MLWNKRPPKPSPRFKRGDLVRHATQQLLVFVVDSVRVYWTLGEWYALAYIHRITNKGKMITVEVCQESLRMHSPYDF